MDQPDPRGAKMIEMLLALLDSTPPAQLQVSWRPVLLDGATIGRYNG